MWPFKDKPAPVPVAPPPPRPTKSPIPAGYIDEYCAIQAEVARMWNAGGGKEGAFGAITREIIALQARLDKHGIGK